MKIVSSIHGEKNHYTKSFFSIKFWCESCWGTEGDPFLVLVQCSRQKLKRCTPYCPHERMHAHTHTHTRIRACVLNFFIFYTYSSNELLGSTWQQVGWDPVTWIEWGPKPGDGSGGGGRGLQSPRSRHPPFSSSTRHPRWASQSHPWLRNQQIGAELCSSRFMRKM